MKNKSRVPTEVWTPEPAATEDAGMSFAIGGAIPRQRDLLVERELQVGQRFYSQGTAEFTGAATFNGGLTGALTATQAILTRATVTTATVTAATLAQATVAAATLTEATATTATVTSLALNGVTVSGPVRFGSATAVVSGTTIAHGLATTPTSVLLTAAGVVTTTPFVLATDATSITVGMLAEADPMTVYWLAGK